MWSCLRSILFPAVLAAVVLCGCRQGAGADEEPDVDMSGDPFYAEKDPVLPEETLRSVLLAKNPKWNGACMTRDCPLGPVLVISNGRGLKDFSPLRNFKLAVLAVGNFQMGSLECLNGLKLKELDLFGAGKLKDISAVKEMPLEEMFIGAKNLRDLSALQKLPLRKLILECPVVTDFSPLRKLTRLEILSVSGHFDDAEFIGPLKKLVALQLRSDRLTRIDAVGKKRSLQGLWLDCPNLRETAAVTRLPRLRFLNIRCAEPPKKDAFPRLKPFGRNNRIWIAPGAELSPGEKK